MSQFSTNEAVSLEKRIDVVTNIKRTNLEDINSAYEIENCTKWIIENDYKKVCLQFPDYLLPDSAQIVGKIESVLNKKVFILGDTAYESCCIDYTAAKHISADAIIHFGTTCFSKTENIIPCLKIYEKFALQVEEFSENVKSKFNERKNVILVIVDTPYLHKIDDIRQTLNDSKFTVYSVEDEYTMTDCTVLYLGENDRKLMNINLTYNPKELFYYDPKVSSEIKDYEQDTKILKRRYFLIEKIKDSATVGIVISTLAVRNYLKIIERIKTLAKVHSKKYYIISVGKPTVAKLANFPEVDIFVVVGCAMNEIYENREFYKPIVTPYDLEAALNPKLENTQFSYDFNKFLNENNEIDEQAMKELNNSDVSLLTGQIRYQDHADKKIDSKCEVKSDEGSTENQISVRPEGKLQVSENYGAGYLASRSWKGLEQDLGKDEPQLATTGRKGIAQSYENETK